MHGLELLAINGWNHPCIPTHSHAQSISTACMAWICTCMWAMCILLSCFSSTILRVGSGHKTGLAIKGTVSRYKCILVGGNPGQCVFVMSQSHVLPIMLC